MRCAFISISNYPKLINPQKRGKEVSSFLTKQLRNHQVWKYPNGRCCLISQGFNAKELPLKLRWAINFYITFQPPSGPKAKNKVFYVEKRGAEAQREPIFIRTNVQINQLQILWVTKSLLVFVSTQSKDFCLLYTTIYQTKHRCFFF